ncbi:hypothetical protein FB451DRAFT_1365385 [Mycena latifolia]|nr:hypothetical protein FB451DRAFT_1365385 [Mycena latifolia]
MPRPSRSPTIPRRRGATPMNRAFQMVASESPCEIYVNGQSRTARLEEMVEALERRLAELEACSGENQDLLSFSASIGSSSSDRESSPSHASQYRHTTTARDLPIGYRKRLLQHLPSIHTAFERGDACALYHRLHCEVQVPTTTTQKNRWKQIFAAYGVAWRKPGGEILHSDDTVEKICADGMAGIQRMRADLRRLGPNFDSLRSAEPEVRDLKASCKNLESLLWKDRSGSTPILPHRVEELLESIKMSPALDLDLLEGVEDFTEAYLAICAISLTGQDTKEKMRELHQLVTRELTKAIERLETFNSLFAKYTEGGRQDLAAVMQKNVKAAKKAGFREGVSSAAEKQQIYDKLEKIDNGLANIRQRLKNSKEFWEGVDRDLKSTQKSTEPPGRSKTEAMAHNIQTGLETVHDAAQQYSGSPRILKPGTRLVRRAFNLTKECTAIASTQSSVEAHLQQPTCNPKSGRKVVSPLTKGFGSIAKSYEKLSQEFTKWAHWIYLLFWFAGSTPADKLRSSIFPHQL